ncbi:hypothetical protein [Rhodanobacter sp. FW106-PBR-R2A-1-13]|uniref:hypothetical protein n=1 Tax=Rhodanobacter sp. FW106-PBR-R2A-1-13 TaxID=3454845 RepID=UPI0034E50D29
MARRLAIETTLLLLTIGGILVAALAIAATQTEGIAMSGGLLAIATLWHLERAWRSVVARAAWLRWSMATGHEGKP